jgi:hypothetical protein
MHQIEADIAMEIEVGIQSQKPPKIEVDAGEFPVQGRGKSMQESSSFRERAI